MKVEGRCIPYKTQSWVHRRCESVTDTNTPCRCGIFRWGIALCSPLAHIIPHPTNPFFMIPPPSSSFPIPTLPYNFQLTFRLIHIIPCPLPPQNILHFLLLQIFPLVESFTEHELIRTCWAFEAVLTHGIRCRWVAGWDSVYAQHVAAYGADYVWVLVGEGGGRGGSRARGAYIVTWWL
jgi:hypothetical protein